MITDNLGVVYDIVNDKAIILTHNSKFIMLNRREDMFLGQQIYFEENEICRPGKNIYRYVSACAGIAAVFILLFLFKYMVPGNNTVFGYVTVDINPSVELCINENYRVLEAVALNEDAEKVIKSIDVQNNTVENAVIDIIRESRKYGYINKEEKNEVLISAALNDVKKAENNNDSDVLNLDNLLNEIKKEIEVQDNNISGKVFRVTSDEREVARKYNISMGKYHLFLKAKELGINISIDKLKDMKVSALLMGVDSKVEVTSPLPTIGQVTEALPSSKQILAPTPTITTIPSNTPGQESTNLYTAENTYDIKEKETTIPQISKTMSPSHTADVQNKGTDGNKSIKLKHYNEQKDILTQMIRWDFVIENTGTETIDLRNVKVRYYLKEETDKKINFAVYFYSLGDEKTDVNGEIRKVSGTDLANRYIEISFDKGSIAPRDSAWVFGSITREDWSKFDQSDDYSYYQDATSFSYWNKITAYISDELVWGIEPD